jgi:hypothetical protein
MHVLLKLNRKQEICDEHRFPLKNFNENLDVTFKYNYISSVIYVAKMVCLCTHVNEFRETFDVSTS